MDLQVLKSPNLKIKLLTGRLYVCVSLISIIEEQTVTETLNLVLFFGIKCRCYLKSFMPIGKMPVHTNSNTLRSMEGISR